MATAKQRAWRAKFARMYGGKKKRSRKKKSHRYVAFARKYQKRKTMARRRYGRRRRRSSGGLGSIKGLGRKVAIGVGAGVALGAVAPQFAGNPLVRHGAAFLLGGPLALGASVILSGGLGGLLGGTSSSKGGW
jgi:hypothetical protein